MSEIQTVLTCDCNPGKRYSSKQTFRAHEKSQRHLSFAANATKDDLRRRLQESEIALMKSMRECDFWKEKYFNQIDHDTEFFDCS